MSTLHAAFAAALLCLSMHARAQPAPAQTLDDAIARAADEDNPRGYFELERVMALAEDRDRIGPCGAGPVRKGGRSACRQSGEAVRCIARGVPLHRVGRPGVVITLFVEVVGSGDEFEILQLAEKLHFLAELLLAQRAASRAGWAWRH